VGGSAIDARKYFGYLVPLEARAMRKFVIHEQPHVADPAWVCPVVELIGENFCKRYSDAGELQRVVSNLQLEIGRQQGYNQESIRAQKYLEHKGWSPEAIKDFLFWNPKSTENG
jgi:hypothetical protein